MSIQATAGRRSGVITIGGVVAAESAVAAIPSPANGFPARIRVVRLKLTSATAPGNTTVRVYNDAAKTFQIFESQALTFAATNTWAGEALAAPEQFQEGDVGQVTIEASDPGPHTFDVVISYEIGA